MKILLIGEYSNLHNSLKKGLVALGHQVTLVGTGDMFKNYPVDLSVRPTIFSDKKFALLLRKILLRISKKDIAQWEIGYKFKKLLPNLKDFDVVQLINSHSIGTFPKTEIPLINTIFKQNKKVVLLACGDDYPVIQHYLDGNERYHVLTPYLESNNASNFNYALKYVDGPYKELFDFIYKNVAKVIPTDIDYKLPWAGWDKVANMIPSPMVLPSEFHPIKINNRKVVVLLGINSMNYVKKGYKFFEEALVKLKNNYPNKVEIKIIRDLPYKEYSKLFDSCDILMDMVYAYDQGSNALEAMAHGKVVFTGAEKEFYEHHHLTKPVNINALPNVESIYKDLEQLILHPEQIEEISINAREFMEKEHDYIKIAQKFVDTWTAE